MSAIAALHELLISPPAGFLYHLILLLSIEAGLGMAVHYWRRSPAEPWARRLILAFGGLLLIRAVMIGIALLVRPDTSIFPALWPPLDRLCSFLSLLIIVWAFVLPLLPRPGRTDFWVLGGGTIIILGFYALLSTWWYFTAAQTPDAYFTGSWPDRAWEVGQVILLGTAIGLLLYRRGPSFLLVSLLTLMVGHLLQLVFPGSHPHVAGWVRVSDLVAYPALAILVYHSISTELQSTAQAFQQELREISQDALQRTQELIFLLDANRNVNASLDLITVLQKVVQSLVDGIGAGYGIIALVEKGEAGLMRAVAGYDPLDQGVWQTSDVCFSLKQYPLLEHVIRRRRRVVVQEVEISAQLIAIHALMGSVEIGPLMIIPLVHRKEVLGLVLLSNANSQKLFTAEDGRFAEALAQQVAAAVANARLYRQVDEQRRRLADLLRAQRKETRERQAILESIADGVIVGDAQGKITMVNAAAERIFGRSQRELLGLPIREFYPRLQEGGNGRQRSTSSWSGEGIHTVFEREGRVIEGSLAPVLSDGNSPAGFVAVFRDVTKERQAERAKSEFVSTVSHELRTPLTSIKGYADLLGSGMAGEISPQQKTFLGTICTNVERMVKLVNDLISISELGGVVELQREAVDVTQVIHEAIETWSPRAAEREIIITAELPSSLPPVDADPSRLRQIMDHLLSNACKFTYPGGKVSVRAELHEDTAGTGKRNTFLLISVSDTGVGIAAEDQERIFERFYRADNPLQVEAGGAGVGLAIVKSLVEAHGGRIWVESWVGEGSVFSFLLPVAQSALQEQDDRNTEVLLHRSPL